MKIILTVEIELDHREGIFAGKDELAEYLKDEIEGMDPGEVEGDNGGIYNITDWSVNT